MLNWGLWSIFGKEKQVNEEATNTKNHTSQTD
jgi:hypothetical protein